MMSKKQFSLWIKDNITDNTEAAIQKLFSENAIIYQNFLSGQTAEYKPHMLSDHLTKENFAKIWDLSDSTLKQVLAQTSLYKKDNILIYSYVAESIDFEQGIKSEFLKYMPNDALTYIERHINEKLLYREHTTKIEQKVCMQMLLSMSEIQYKRQQTISAAATDNFTTTLDKNMDVIQDTSTKTDVLHSLIMFDNKSGIRDFTSRLHIPEFVPERYYQSFTGLAHDKLELLHENLSPTQWAVMEKFYLSDIFTTYLYDLEKKSYINTNTFKSIPQFFKEGVGDNSLVRPIANAIVESYEKDKSEEFFSIVPTVKEANELALFLMIFNEPEKLATYLQANPNFKDYTANMYHIKESRDNYYTVGCLQALMTTDKPIMDALREISHFTQEEVQANLTRSQGRVNRLNLLEIIKKTDVIDAPKLINYVSQHTTGMQIPPETQKIFDYLNSEYMLDAYVQGQSIAYLSDEARKILDIKKEQLSLAQSIEAGQNKKNFKL